MFIPDTIRAGLARHSSIHKVLANTSWLFVERIFTMAVSFLVGAWMVRYLGPERFGLLSYAGSYVSLFGVFASLGLNEIVVRNLVRAKEATDDILGTALALRLVAGVVTATIVLITGWQLEDDLLTRSLIAILSVTLIFQSFDIITYWFDSQLLSKYVVWARSATLLVGAVLRVGVILTGMPLVAFVWVLLAESVLVAIGLALLFRHQGQSFARWRFQFGIARKLVGDSWPLILSGFAVSIYMKIDQVMLKTMAGASEAGIYAAAVKLSELWYFIPVAIAASFFPSIIRSRESQSEQVYGKRMQAFYDIMATLSYLIILPTFLLAGPLVRMLYGAGYEEASVILQIHIWAFLFVSVGVARGKWLVTENMAGFSMLATILGAIVNVALNYWLIPGYGGVGAAWATLIAYAISAYFSSLLSTRLWPIFGQISLSLLAPLRLHSLRRALREIL
jgi:PST family polysaccharide transporter